MVPQLSKGICHFLIELLFYLEFRTLVKSCFFKVEKCIKIQTRKLHVYFYYSLKVNEVEVKKAPSNARGDRWQLPFLYCHTFDLKVIKKSLLKKCTLWTLYLLAASLKLVNFEKLWNFLVIVD